MGQTFLRALGTLREGWACRQVLETLRVGQVVLLAQGTLSEDRAFHVVQETLSEGRETLSEAQAYLQVRETWSGELAGTEQQIQGRGKDDRVEVQGSQGHRGISDGHPGDRIVDLEDLRASLGDHQGP